MIILNDSWGLSKKAYLQLIEHKTNIGLTNDFSEYIHDGFLASIYLAHYWRFSKYESALLNKVHSYILRRERIITKLILRLWEHYFPELPGIICEYI